VTTAFHFHQDPVAYFEVPRDDRYSVQIRDGLHRGREDFVYRLTVGEIPFVTSVFPLGAPWDERTQIKLEGVESGESHAHDEVGRFSADTTVPVAHGRAGGGAVGASSPPDGHSTGSV
jgi:hypothetical protein